MSDATMTATTTTTTSPKDENDNNDDDDESRCLLLNDDVWLHILSFVPNVVSLHNVGVTSKQSYHCIFGSSASWVWKALWETQFGCQAGGWQVLAPRPPPPPPLFCTTKPTFSLLPPPPCGEWQGVWKRLYQFRRGLSVATDDAAADAAADAGLLEEGADATFVVATTATTAVTSPTKQEQDPQEGDLDQVEEEEEEEKEPQEQKPHKRPHSSQKVTRRKRQRRQRQRRLQQHEAKIPGVLPTQDEEDALLYDNPRWKAKLQQDPSSLPPSFMPPSLPSLRPPPCMGYFGCVCVPIRPSTTATSTHRVAVWGDFNGIFFFDSIVALAGPLVQQPSMSTSPASDSGMALESSVASSESNMELDSTVSCESSTLPFFLGQHDGGRQVLAVLVCPPSDDKKDDAGAAPCLFLGRASGMVQSIAMDVLSNDAATKTTSTTTTGTSGDGGLLPRTLESCTVHTNEVTSLAFLPRALGLPPILASGSFDGKVYLYENAMRRERGYSLDTPPPVLAYTSPQRQGQVGCGSIFAMAATRVCIGGKTWNLLCIGESGHLVMTGAAEAEARGLCTGADQGEKEEEENDDVVATSKGLVVLQDIPLARSDASERRRWTMTVSKIQFIQSGKTLVTANNSGSVTIWDLTTTTTPSAAQGSRRPLEDAPPMLRLVPRVRWVVATEVPECMDTMGNILLTSSRGEIRAWDCQTGRAMGCISCHEGKSVESLQHWRVAGATKSSAKRKRGALKSVVMGWMLVDNGRLLSMCRDGTLSLWDFEQASRRARRPEKGKDKTPCTTTSATRREWECHVCTLLNDAKTYSCAACRVRKKRIRSARPPKEGIKEAL